MQKFPYRYAVHPCQHPVKAHFFHFKCSHKQTITLPGDQPVGDHRICRDLSRPAIHSTILFNYPIQAKGF